MKKVSLFAILIMSVFIFGSTLSFAQPKRMVVWNGETASKAAGWTNPAATCTISAQTIEAHSGKTAVEFRFKGDGKNGWLGCGWDWASFQVGEYGTDISAMKNFSFWLKVKGTSAELSFNLLCNGGPALDQPQHHTEKVIVSKYCPDWKDGNWHQVVVPLADLVQPKGFDAKHVAEMQFFNTGEGDGSFFIDDLAFDDGSFHKQ
ncbi:MAG: carbohydrate binding domain-containing protein [Bacteroidia bacterium]